jgi:hypothetical protein
MIHLFNGEDDDTDEYEDDDDDDNDDVYLNMLPRGRFICTL